MNFVYKFNKKIIIIVAHLVSTIMLQLLFYALVANLDFNINSLDYGTLRSWTFSSLVKQKIYW